MHLKAHKLILAALLLFGVGLLLGTGMGNMYRRHIRADAARLATVDLGSGSMEQELVAECFPREVGGMVQTNLLTGDQAADFIGRFLGPERRLSSAYIGTYKGAEREVVIFMAKFSAPAEAEAVFAAMERALEKNDTFTEVSEKHIFEDITVNYLLDDKNSHYFYLKGNRVIWLMAGPQECIETLMDFYLSF